MALPLSILYILIWISLLVAVIFLKRGNKFAENMHQLFLNKQIQKFKHPPFNFLLKLWTSNKFLPAVFAFIFLIILPATFMYFLLGILLLTPVVVMIQGFTAGILIGKLTGKNIFWAIIVCIFEFGYWAIAGTLGLVTSIRYLFTDLIFIDSLTYVNNLLMTEYWIPLVICIMGNAFIEIAGPIYWNVIGAIKLDILNHE